MSIGGHEHEYGRGWSDLVREPEAVYAINYCLIKVKPGAVKHSGASPCDSSDRPPPGAPGGRVSKVSDS